MRNEEQDVVKALELGADDYMRKPLLRIELKARLESLLRRIQGNKTGADLIEHGPYRFDIASKTAYVDGKSVEMTDKDFEVLQKGTLRPDPAPPDTIVAVSFTKTNIDRI